MVKHKLSRRRHNAIDNPILSPKLIADPARDNATPSVPKMSNRLLRDQRPQPYFSTGDLPIASVHSVGLHDAQSLVKVVLDAEYLGGVHLAHADGVFWEFDQTHWRSLSQAELGGVILAHLPPAANRTGRSARATIREVVDLLRMHRATSPDSSCLNDPPPIINVRNGELWISSDGSVELRPHNPASNLRNCLDVVYDPAATCEHYDRALAEIFSRSSEPATLVALWHEFVGYVLQPSRPDARIFVGWGGGNDGKSALTGLLVNLLGRHRVAAMPVGKLASNDFMFGHLPNNTKPR